MNEPENNLGGAPEQQKPPWPEVQRQLRRERLIRDWVIRLAYLTFIALVLIALVGPLHCPNREAAQTQSAVQKWQLRAAEVERAAAVDAANRRDR